DGGAAGESGFGFKAVGEHVDRLDGFERWHIGRFVRQPDVDVLSAVDFGVVDVEAHTVDIKHQGLGGVGGRGIVAGAYIVEAGQGDEQRLVVAADRVRQVLELVAIHALADFGAVRLQDFASRTHGNSFIHRSHTELDIRADRAVGGDHDAALHGGSES